jgi:hypothetical protein
MEKNKLALEIWQLKYEMSLQGIDVQIPVFTLCKRCNNITLSLSAQFGFRLDIFLFSKVTNINIQTHPTLNAYPHKVIKVCIIYLLKH